MGTGDNISTASGNRQGIAPPEPGQVPRNQGEGLSSPPSDSSIRVDVGLLDKLMNLVGELVLARNQILQFSTTQQDATFLNTSQRLNLITTELQESVMKTRMQPIGNIWVDLPSMVLDLAANCDKQIRLEMEGKETELDKTLIESIKDPLAQLVRNAVTHAIETPAGRAKAGKPAAGRVYLRAFHEGGQVNIEISDDGAGIDVDRVKQRALEKGLVAPEQAAHLTDREILNLLFQPGWSAAQDVTAMPGCGAGMDIVKTQIDRIGGTVDIQSQPGQGTTLKIKIPLTLAIIPALLVTSGGGRYAIPQVSLVELVRLEGDQACRGIEIIHDAPVYRLRGKLLPLAYLNRQIGLADEREGGSAHRAAGRQTANIVVLQADDRRFGLVVDEINDTEEIVVKPLGKQLKGIATFAGATIMGDGRVALILDVLGLAQRANVVASVRDRSVGEKAAGPEAIREDGESLLLLCGPDDGRIAMPLSQVARLEEFNRSSVEKTEGRHVVQYRGRILPLIHLSSALPGRHRPSVHWDPTATQGEGEKIQVVVYTDQGASVGLVVDRILDIAHEKSTTHRNASCNGSLGSVVIHGRVTELLDVKRIIHAADPSFLPEHAAI